MTLRQTSTTDPDFLKLEKLLDEELRQEYPDEMGHYAPHNKFKAPIKTILVFEKNKVIACGAIKELEDHVEVKRMFVCPDYRGKGYSRIVLTELEEWSKTLGYQYAILETGKKLFKATNLYQSAGYQIIPNYGPYIDLETSVCMKKTFR